MSNVSQSPCCRGILFQIIIVIKKIYCILNVLLKKVYFSEISFNKVYFYEVLVYFFINIHLYINIHF